MRRDITRTLPYPILLLLLLLPALGCSECGGDEDEHECRVSADCRADQACLDGRCEYLGECLTNDHCPSGSACIQGICVVRATADCSSDSGCQPPSTICSGGRCVAGCATTGCAPSERCEAATGRCLAATGACFSDSDCSPPSTVCSGTGECVAGCLDGGCSSGWVCNSATGRCMEDTSGCVSDVQCSPPSTICDSVSGDCVAGCSTSGCPSGWSCGAGGRCVEDSSGCRLDQDCDPPATVCDAGADACVPGCLSAGCPNGWECDDSIGRCTEAVDVCEYDFDCSPPDSVCDPLQGLCAPGCLATGCTGVFTCDQLTGRCVQEVGCYNDNDCEEGHICESTECVPGCRTSAGCPQDQVCADGACVPDCLASPCQSPDLCDPSIGLCEPPGTVQMGGVCLDNAGEPEHKLCASDYCFPGSGTCTMPCTASMQCTTTGWQCLHVEPKGARACGYNPGTGSGAPGDPCGNCKPHWCWDNKCTDDCQHDRDCPQLNYVCRAFYGEETNYLDVLICATPTAGSGNTGQSCSQDSHCRRSLCLGGKCADPCHTSFDCPSGYVCSLVPATNGSALRLCLPADGPTGTAGPGTYCDPATQLPCRSRLCAELTDELGVCIDTCATHADCGSGMRCEIIAIDTTGNEIPDQTVPVCLFR